MAVAAHQKDASEVRPLLRDALEALPEASQRIGYQTCPYAENQSLTRRTGFGQGFEAARAPWDDAPARGRGAPRDEGPP